MPTMQLDPTLTMFYEDDWFGEPWRQPDVALLVHGCAESSQAWYGWVPHLARHLRVLRPDLRGFGRSSAPPEGYAWSPVKFADDLARFLDQLGVGSVHLIGAKLGGTISMHFAANYPERVRTLTVLSPLVRVGPERTGVSTFSERIRAVGVREWAAETQGPRLGSAAPADLVAGWTDLMAASSPEVCIGVTAAAAGVDLLPILPRVQAPTLVVTTEGSAVQSVEAVREWMSLMKSTELLVMPGDSYHIAAVDPDGCADSLMQFLAQRSRET